MHLTVTTPNHVPLDAHIDVVRYEEEVDVAVQKLRDDAACSKLDRAKVVGVDIEWHAPRIKGVSPSKISLIQICSSANYCAVFLVTKMEKFPSSLWPFMRDREIRKIDTT